LAANKRQTGNYDPSGAKFCLELMGTPHSLRAWYGGNQRSTLAWRR